jgi:hypothetical protein
MTPPASPCPTLQPCFRLAAHSPVPPASLPSCSGSLRLCASAERLRALALTIAVRAAYGGAGDGAAVQRAAALALAGAGRGGAGKGVGGHARGGGCVLTVALLGQAVIRVGSKRHAARWHGACRRLSWPRGFCSAFAAAARACPSVVPPPLPPQGAGAARARLAAAHSSPGNPFSLTRALTAGRRPPGSPASAPRPSYLATPRGGPPNCLELAVEAIIRVRGQRPLGPLYRCMLRIV